MAEKTSQPDCMDDLVIALVLFEGAEEQDVVGPFEMFYWMSLFEGLPPHRRPIGEPDFAVDFISESEFVDYFYGPPVSPPQRRGFGTVVMKEMAERCVDGRVELDYAPSGVTWRLTCPAANALEPPQGA